ncbi:hypothetical protein L9F63_015001, partial [Diploptera punctata]
VRYSNKSNSMRLYIQRQFSKTHSVSAVIIHSRGSVYVKHIQTLPLLNAINCNQLAEPLTTDISQIWSQFHEPGKFVKAVNISEM